MKALPWLLVAVVAGGWVKSYGDKRASDALAEVRRDSMMIIMRRARTLEVQMRHIDSLRMLAESTQVRIERNSKREMRLAISAASDHAGRRARDSLLTTLPDTAPLAIQIRAERRIGETCLTALGACDSTVTILRARLASRDTLLARGDTLRNRLTELWEAAEKRSRPGFFGRLRIGLPFAALGAAVVLVLK